MAKVVRRNRCLCSFMNVLQKAGHEQGLAHSIRLESLEIELLGEE